MLPSTVTSRLFHGSDHDTLLNIFPHSESLLADSFHADGVSTISVEIISVRTATTGGNTCESSDLLCPQIRMLLGKGGNKALAEIAAFAGRKARDEMLLGEQEPVRVTAGIFIPIRFKRFRGSHGLRFSNRILDQGKHMLKRRVRLKILLCATHIGMEDPRERPKGGGLVVGTGIRSRSESVQSALKVKA